MNLEKLSDRQGEVVKSYLDGTPIHEIVKNYGCSPASISRWLRKADAKPSRKFKPINTKEAAELYKTGMTLDQLAAKYNRSIAFMYHHLKSRVVFDLEGRRRRGPNHWNWKGGRSSEWDDLRNDKRYQDWRTFVLTRDPTCRLCGLKSNHAHHIVMKVKDPTRIYDPTNGAGLCPYCHNNLVTGREHLWEELFKTAIETNSMVPPESFAALVEQILHVTPAMCACGCGQPTRAIRGRYNKYLDQHKNRRPVHPNSIKATEATRFKPMGQQKVIQAQLLRETGMSTRKIAAAMGVSQAWAWKATQKPAN